jgi:hypothetical protein
VDDRSIGLGPLEGPTAHYGATEFGQGQRMNSHTVESGAEVRAARAKVVEDTAYRLPDIFTIISGRIEILSDKVPGMRREELLPIRSVAMRGVELNKRLFLAAQECRGELGS